MKFNTGNSKVNITEKISEEDLKGLEEAVSNSSINEIGNPTKVTQNRRVESKTAGNDVMTQGATFKPEDSDEDSDMDEEDSHIPRKLKPSSLNKTNKIMIMAGIMLSIIIVVFFGVYSVQQNKKLIKEREDALMQAIDDYEFMYSDVEISQLRAYGYTADEIEAGLVDQILYDTLISDAKKLIKDTYDKEMAPYMDATSVEFQELKDMTWLSGQPLDYDVNVAREVIPIFTKDVALDYIKLPPYGLQLWIRIKNNDDYIFHSIDPAVFSDMPESGKVIVQMEYKKVNDKVIVTDVVVKDYNK